MRLRLDLNRHLEHDRQKAAAHEAAHLVVAEHFGARSIIASVWRHPCEDLNEEKAYLGRCGFCGPLHETHKRVIAVAGAVADVFFSEVGGGVLCLKDCASVRLHEEGDLYDWAYEDMKDSEGDSALYGGLSEDVVFEDDFRDAILTAVELLAGPLNERWVEVARQLVPSGGKEQSLYFGGR
jgi:hypothetical protein